MCESKFSFLLGRFLGELLGHMAGMAFLVAQTVKSLPAVWETQVQSLGWEDPLEKEMATHSSILPGEFQGQRSLAGCCPWGRKESDMTE